MGLSGASGQQVFVEYQFDKAHCFRGGIADNRVFLETELPFWRLPLAPFEGALKHCSAFYTTQTFQKLLNILP